MCSEKTGIRKQVLEEIIDLAKFYDLSRVILFGSRARGDYLKKSDIDLAVEGKNIVDFALDVDEKTDTLLQYDIVDMSKADEELLKNIRKDGITLYEKIR
ncbi:nucleotidyltransferase domain-containing protein [Faecalicatena orotica]|uniref:Nucleotidyltransferase-like protein n=1 Tax=Faecalicatena orotica TaxID=1544 RepID=A0A2Y9BIQ6_9FIRM|nr:nucleotidyltransferase domain-containing protein [Faecalicatena orotica]PWJ29085.1 nucleotidyltransferase-like protein [Faecalicatena orotica]SSA56255.1 Nucleotidyltransferase domain-containing protein [Faecalicatena orotica]